MCKVGIYKIENKINKKVYIGQSINIEMRWKNHIRNYNLNKNKCKKVQSDWNIYGKDNFEFKILELINIDKLTKYDRNFLMTFREHYNMIKYNSIKEGYNDPDYFPKMRDRKEFNGIILPNNFYNNLDSLMDIEDIKNRITIL